MGQKEAFQDLLEELNHVHSGASPWSKEIGIPDFVTAENGQQVHYPKKARTALRLLSEIFFSNRTSNSFQIDFEKYEIMARQAIADMYAAGHFCNYDESDKNELIGKLKTLIEERISKLNHKYTYYFSAWTLGMEKESPFVLGPVTFLSQLDWVNSVDFPPSGKDNFLNQRDANYRWKDIIKNALINRDNQATLEGLAGAVYGALTQCPSLLKVTISGYEMKLSCKLAKLVCKTALDAISLGFGGSECFFQQALYEERLPPLGSNSLVETNGFLWLPGSQLGKRIPTLSGARVTQALRDMSPLLPAFASILNGLASPSTHKHPKLASRWATALDWFGEGNRESSDAIALTKLGTCLDVLCCGGKNDGIREMVIHLTGIKSDEQVIGGNHPRTLKQLVKDIYDHGRSKILHGTHHDRLESFAQEREYAAYLSRIILIECALRLVDYQGTDDDKAFRKIPAAPIMK